GPSIALPKPAEEASRPPLHLGPPWQQRRLVHQDRKDAGDVALLHEEIAFHEGLTEGELRVANRPDLGGAGEKPDFDVRSGPVAERLADSVGRGDGDGAPADEAPQDPARSAAAGEHLLDTSLSLHYEDRGCFRDAPIDDAHHFDR